MGKVVPPKIFRAETHDAIADGGGSFTTRGARLCPLDSERKIKPIPSLTESANHVLSHSSRSAASDLARPMRDRLAVGACTGWSILVVERPIL